MPQIIYAQLDADGLPVEIPRGREFLTYWKVIEDEDELAVAVASLMPVAAVGDRAPFHRSHAANVLDLWNEADLAVNCVQAVTLADAPDGQRLVSYSLAADEAGAIAAVAEFEAVPLDEVKAARVAEAEAEYATRMAAGFPAPSLGVGETLQCRDAVDMARWLALKDSCGDAIEAGLGADPCPLTIRTTANTNHRLTYADAAQLMKDLRTWGSTMLSVLWAKKDAIQAAPDATAVAAVDLTSDWPS